MNMVFDKGVATKRIIHFIALLTISIITLFSSVNLSFAQNKVKTVIIDAGHGGKDPGAIGFFSKEKDITLAVALRLEKMIKDSIPDLKPILTRSNDIFIELKGRHEIANKGNGDLFVSVHVNATAAKSEKVRTGYRYVGKGSKKRKVATYKTIYHKETSTSGTETYVLGLHRNNQKEKAITEFADIVVDEPGMLDEQDPTTSIIISQYSQRFLSRSVALAGKIQENFSKQGRRDLGVKQLGLEVLAGSAMPGVLVEIGFINNVNEEKYLNTPEGVLEVTTAIYNGIKAYKTERERGL